LVPVENQGSYTHPTVAELASPFLSSLPDAKSKLQPTSKIARKCTAFLRLQPLNSPTRFREDPFKKVPLLKPALKVMLLVSPAAEKNKSWFEKPMPCRVPLTLSSVLRNSAELHWDAQRGWNGLPRPWDGGR
jgi:hypothetical protein